MAEYIKQKIQGGKKSICDSCTHRNVCKAIDNQPCTECNHYQCTADVYPVNRGRWLCVDTDEEQFFLCNRCKKKEYWESNYCPNCGARMDLPEQAEEEYHGDQ